MKRLFGLFICTIILLSFCFLLSSCDTGTENGGNPGTSVGTGGDTGGNTDGGTGGTNSGHTHVDVNSDDVCDSCHESVIVVIDFYVINDLHGKFCDTATQPGVDELATYLKQRRNIDDNVVVLSSGDMWQGTAESNLTGGLIITEWMNEMDFVAMTLGNHEYDWGEDAIRENLQAAEFPFLAINIYDLDTNQLADYCTPSVLVELDGVQIGIIGAIGDCYSSISSNMVEGVEFKVGNELTALVKAESLRLRAAGADIIVYSLHDGYGSSSNGTFDVSSSSLDDYYNTSLSNGYVDVVFESHTHQYYTLIDSYDVYHLQGGGENYGLSHVEMSVNTVSGSNRITDAKVIRSSSYSSLSDDAATEALEDKYSEVIDYAYNPLGRVSKTYNSGEIADVMAELYLEAALEKWGDDYDIVLGGGYIVPRSPYSLTTEEKNYADILSLFPFDNRLVLCKVSGSNLLSQFIETSDDSYHIALSDYGESIIGNISYSGTYYVMVDTYSSLYTRNGLTVVDYYDQTTFARDLLADAISDGRFDDSHTNYNLTSIPDALSIGSSLSANATTVDYFYVKGTVTTVPDSTWGNLYICDDEGNQIYVYGLYDRNGNRYDVMTEKPAVGDTVILYSQIMNYVNYYSGTSKIELNDATLIELNPD